MSAVKPPQQRRKAAIPPKKITPGMSVYSYLSKCSPPLHKKIVDIACAETKIPSELKDDAAQEIFVMWSMLKPDTHKYKPSQIAAYAHKMAKHAALRLQRELGSPVRLPGSAFRKRKDGSTYVTPGVLANALDWNDLESWFQTDELADMIGGGVSALSIDADGVSQLLEDDGQLTFDEDSDEALFRERIAHLEVNKEALTKRQYLIMKSLLEGSSFEEIQTEHTIKKGVLMRELAIVSGVLGSFMGY